MRLLYMKLTSKIFYEMLLVFWKELLSKEKLTVTELDLENSKGLVKSNFSRMHLTLQLFYNANCFRRSIIISDSSVLSSKGTMANSHV